MPVSFLLFLLWYLISLGLESHWLFRLAMGELLQTKADLWHLLFIKQNNAESRKVIWSCWKQQQTQYGNIFHLRADSGSVKLLLLFLRFSLLFIAKESRRQIKLFKQQRSVAVLWFCFVPLLALVFTSTLLFLRSVSQPEQNDCKHIFVVPSQIPVLGDFHSS